MKILIVLFVMFINAFGLSNIVCEQQYKNFIEYGSSENTDDLRYALLSFRQMQLNNCLLTDDDYTIAIYVANIYAQKVEERK